MNRDNSGAAISAVQARWREGIVVFVQHRLLIILCVGFSSGLPLARAGSTLTIWMKDVGVDIRAIGLYALVGLPYTFKFVWAPLMDAWRVPFLSRRLGHRRGWLIFSQLILIAAILFLGSLDPLAAPLMVALGAVIVAAASATQDIVIDAFRVEYLKSDEQAAGMAYFVAAYRIGMLAAGAGVLFLVAGVETVGITPADVGFYGYAAMAGLMVVGMAAALAATEPSGDHVAGRDAALEGDPNPGRRLLRTALHAFSDFLSKDWAIAILVFVVLYKLCDTFAGIMTGPFVLDIGFSKESYAAIVKGVGLAASLAGGVAGGLMARAMPIGRALLIAGILQMLSNLVFVWQAWIGVNHLALTATIIVENFTGSIGTVIFVAYLAALCSNPLHTATQFALLTALSSVGRVILSSMSGYVAAATGWIWFFALTPVLALPGLTLLVWLDRRGHFALLAEKSE